MPNQPLSIVEALCSGFCTARLGLNTRISLVQKYGLFCFGPEADAQVGADTRSYLSSGMSRYTSTGTVGRLLGWMGRLRGVGDRNYMSVWVNVGADQDCFAACSGSSFGPASLRSAVQHCCRNVVEQRFESEGIPGLLRRLRRLVLRTVAANAATSSRPAAGRTRLEPSRFSSWSFLLGNKKGPRLGPFSVAWLGDQDSNLGWRSQSPQSYR